MAILAVLAAAGLLSWFFLDVIHDEVREQLFKRGETDARHLANAVAGQSVDLPAGSLETRDREILLRFDTLIKTKTPKFEQYWTTRSKLDERRLIKKAAQVWNGITKGVFVANDTSWKCKGCADGF